MNLKSKLLVLLISIFVTKLFAQDPVYKKYTWEANPKIHQMTDEEKEYNYIKIKQTIIFDYIYEENGALVMYETIHSIIHFNNEKGIEEMNKIYIPYSKILEEMDLKARTISASGKIIPLNKSSIKKVDNLENAGPFLIFAMEGVEKGGEIEYLYTNKKSATIYSSWSIQDDNIRRDLSVDLYSPENLIFEIKGYNGFPEVVKDTSLTSQNHISASVKKIDALKDEKYSVYNANRMRFEIQLAYNTVKGNGRMYTWELNGLSFYNSLFSFTKKELSAIDKLISKLDLEKQKSDELKILTLEQWVKTNIGNATSDEELTIDKMMDVKYGNDEILQKVYIGVAQQLKIPVELVLTCDRSQRKFDSNFPTNNSITDYLTYFPSIGKYLSSDNYSSRLGFPPPFLTGTKGLFIKETAIGDLKTGVSKIKSIDYSPAQLSYNNIDAKVEFNPETYVPVVKFKQDFGGYSAFFIQPQIPYMNETEQKQFLDDMAKFPGKETVVKSVKMSGIKNNDVMVNPLVIESVVETSHLLQNAGNKLLFKVGELIGPQEELYQEKKRQLEGEIQYAHSLGRTLEIKIPKGFKLKNPDDIKIEKTYMQDGKNHASFISSYVIEGDVMKIKVLEVYETLLYSKEKYEEWRSVINAAADFNKIVLIFEKI
jgi:hypothetical protein